MHLLMACELSDISLLQLGFLEVLFLYLSKSILSDVQ